MTPADVLAFMRRHTLAVQCSIADDGSPQAAVVGIVTTDAFEIFFDTLDTTRKWRNLSRDPRIAFVIYDELRTVQYEGVVTKPEPPTLEKIQPQYFEAFPEGRDRAKWEGIAYFLARPTWIRYSDYSAAEPLIVEFGADDLER